MSTTPANGEIAAAAAGADDTTSSAAAGNATSAVWRLGFRV